MTNTKIPSLYEWAGGAPALTKLFDEFYNRVRTNTILEPVFRHMDAHHAQIVAKFVGEVLGGPTEYSGDGQHSHSSMVAKHIGKMLNEEQRAEWMRLLLKTADDLGLPSDPEFRSALVSYLEWGSRIAQINSHAKENPIDESAPMPKWGWGEVKGPWIPK
jgi:hemoglobin